MDHWLSLLTLLAENGAPPGGGGGSSLLVMLIPFLLIFVLFQFLFNPRKQEQKRVAQLTQSLKKNDRVVTIGGIIGTVAQIWPEKGEVSIKVDDNARLKMRLASIHEVIRDEAQAPSESAAASK